MEVPGCQNDISKLRKAKLRCKCRKTASSYASDWEHFALRTAPASLQNFPLQCTELWWWLARHPVSYVAKALRHSNILISCCPHNNYAGSNTNPDASIVAQGRETRFSKLCQVNFCSKSSFLVKHFEANTCSARRIAARPSHPTKEGWPPDRRLTVCWGSLSSRSGQLLTGAGKHTACRNLKQAHAG